MSDDTLYRLTSDSLASTDLVAIVEHPEGDYLMGRLVPVKPVGILTVTEANALAVAGLIVEHLPPGKYQIVKVSDE